MTVPTTNWTGYVESKTKLNRRMHRTALRLRRSSQTSWTKASDFNTACEAPFLQQLTRTVSLTAQVSPELLTTQTP